MMCTRYKKDLQIKEVENDNFKLMISQFEERELQSNRGPQRKKINTEFRIFLGGLDIQRLWGRLLFCGPARY
jgi:hypothetical protein